jgi:hypothetical protein
MNGVTTLYTVPLSSADNTNNCLEIENHHPISIPGIEGIIIPCGSHGYIFKVLEEDAALVRWEVKYFLCKTYTSFYFGISLHDSLDYKTRYSKWPLGVDTVKLLTEPYCTEITKNCC